MRHLRLVLPALAFVVAGTWSSQATACDKAKTTNASAAASKTATCTAEMAAACTPEMAAACKAKGVKGARTAAFIASGSCASKGATAVLAASSGRCASKSSATTAAYDHCGSAKGAKATSVLAAASSAPKRRVLGASDHCGSKSIKTTASVAGAGQSCGTSKTRVSASAAGSACSGHGMANVAAKVGHGDCDACADMAECYEELEAVNARTQVVPLKNGVMFVYTAENAGQVNAVQSAMSRRNERLTQIVTAGDKASLCPECKSIRGAMASGKMSREVINIEGGALTLMTSNDPAVVAKIHALVDSHKASRSKS